MSSHDMVTRTVISTKCVVMTVNVEAGETFTEVVNVPKVFKDEKKLLNACKKMLETDTVKVVAVVSSTVTKELYGMPTDKFMENAVLLDEKRKPITQDNVTPFNEKEN